MYRAVWDWSHWMPGSGSENGDKFMKSGFSKAMRLKQKGEYSSDVRCRQHCGPCCVMSLKLGMHKSNNALFHSVSGVRKQLVGVCLFLERISFRVQTCSDNESRRPSVKFACWWEAAASGLSQKSLASAIPTAPSQSNQCTDAKARPSDWAFASNPGAMLKRASGPEPVIWKHADSLLQASCAF